MKEKQFYLYSDSWNFHVKRWKYGCPRINKCLISEALIHAHFLKPTLNISQINGKMSKSKRRLKGQNLTMLSLPNTCKILLNVKSKYCDLRLTLFLCTKRMTGDCMCRYITDTGEKSLVSGCTFLPDATAVRDTANMSSMYWCMETVKV